MLTELRIENFAIIHHLDLAFQDGLIAFTGETGAGKSIILDALETVLGGKADPTFVRSGAERASVEATFHLSPETRPAVHAVLQREDLLDDPDYVVLARDLRREGRSTARVNGHSVSTGLLREVGAFLVDIHGQSEHLSLLNVHHHLGLLDRYAGVQDLLSSYERGYRELQGLRKELAALRQAQQDAIHRRDLLTFQAEEIESAHLRPGEEEELRLDRTRLSNAENLSTLAHEALTLLDEGSSEIPAITDQLGQVVHAVGNLARIDPRKAELHQQVEIALETLSDASRELRRYMDGIEFNARRLQQVEERLDLLSGLKRKYGGSLEAVLEHGKTTRAQLEMIATANERITELEKQADGLLKTLAGKALDLSARRRKAGEKMAAVIESELAELSMVGARFSVDIQAHPDANGLPMPDGSRAAFDASGIDQVEFLVAPNQGEGLKPLAKIASGGETSRLMLALKNALAQADTIATLVFDEIDQGIGGRVGLVVGEKLWKLGQQHQVLCVTHLPQLAAFGSQHLRVSKQVREGRTQTDVELLQGETRRKELAQMIGVVTEGTLRSADEILKTVQQKTGLSVDTR